MNRRPPPRPQQPGRPQSGRPQSGRPEYRWHRYHWYPYHNWYWYNYDYDYDWSDYYDDDLDLYDYYYHFDRYDASKDAFEQGFRAGLKQARSQHTDTNPVEPPPPPSAGYCGSVAGA